MASSEDNPPRRRRVRRAQPAFSRQGIIEVALAILRDEGLDKVTMRRIAAALDTGASSLYVYVRSTEDLHAQLLDALLEAVVAAVPSGGTWCARLTALLKHYMLVLFNHPEIARMAMSTQPSGPNYLSLVDAILALLTEGGVPDREAAWAVDLLLLFATAIAAEHGSREPARHAEEFSALSEAIASADTRRYPHIARLGREILSGSGPERFQWGIDVFLTGVLGTPRTPPEEEIV